MTKLISRVWTKPQTQETIKALRGAGLTVIKHDVGFYSCTVNDILVFKAMAGRNGYLVRYDPNLCKGA